MPSSGCRVWLSDCPCRVWLPNVPYVWSSPSLALLPNLCSFVWSSSSLAFVSSQLQEVIPVSSRERIPYQTHSCAGLTFPALASLSVHVLICVAESLRRLRPALVPHPPDTIVNTSLSTVNLPSPSSNSGCDYSLNFCVFVSMCWSVLHELSMHKLVGCLQAAVTFGS